MARIPPALLAILSFLIPLTTTAAVSLPPSNAPRTHCTSSETWIRPPFSIFECLEAVDRLYYQRVAHHADSPFQFLSPDQTSPHYPHLPVASTPQKFTVASCTVAIVMLRSFAPGALPGQPTPPGGHEYSPWEVGRYSEVWEATKRIVLGCVRPQEQGGWEAVGEGGNLGVFVWSTGSVIDRGIHAAVGTLPAAKNGTSWRAPAGGAVTTGSGDSLVGTS